MTKDKLLNFYHNKISHRKLIYDHIPIWKRVLQNILILLVVALLVWPSLEILIFSSRPDFFFTKLLKLLTICCLGYCLTRLIIYLHEQSVAEQFKRTPRLKTFYIGPSKVDWVGFREWQRSKMSRKLKKWGYRTPRQIQMVDQHLGEWMKRERFWLIATAALYAAIGLPVWAAFLSSVFEKDTISFGERTLLFLIFSFISVVTCLGIKMSNDIYNQLFSQYSKILEVRDLVEDVAIDLANGKR